MTEPDTSVKVAVRIRPLNPEEYIQDDTSCINTVSGAPQIVVGTDTFFTFDYVFGTDSTQALIYEACVADLVNAAFEGFNATILAYGQTGSGKTWTMGSAAGYDLRMTAETMGIIPRVIQNIFEIVRQREANDPNSTYKVLVQFLEIYGEDIKDLLDHTKTSKVTIRETATGEVFVSGAREEVVSSTAQMLKALEDGTRHRTTAATLMNQSSSRSHAIFTVILEHTIHTGAVLDPNNISSEESDNKEEDGNGKIVQQQMVESSKAEVRKCKFHFVDLAGSERAKRSGAQGQQLKEGIDINKGLLALGNVISALGDETKRGKVHVPYRDSKLTRMLQDSLGGNSKTLMICCVSPAVMNFNESLNALRYANRARNIQNKPIVNRDPTMLIIDELRGVVKMLASELLDVRRDGLVPAPENCLSILDLEKMASSGVVSGSSVATAMTSSSIGKPLSVVPSKFTSASAVHNRMMSQGSGIADDMSLLLPSSSAGSSAAASMHRRTAATSSSDGVAAATAAILNSAASEVASKELMDMKSRCAEADFEVRRLSEQLKLARIQASELSDRVVLIQSERDFFKIKWSDACPAEAKALARASSKSAVEFLRAVGGSAEDIATEEAKVIEGDTAEDMTDEELARERVAGKEKETVTHVIAGYLREIDSLKKQLVELQQMQKMTASAMIDMVDEGELLIEHELTSNVAKVIAQTEEHLVQEARRLKSISGISAVSSSTGNTAEAVIVASLEDSDDEGAEASQINNKKTQIEADVSAFQRRQKIMTREVAELGESIQLKEQLVNQLRRSHYQYGVMKAFYEQKLQSLNEELGAKETEREQLLNELHELEQTKHEAEAVKHKLERQNSLRNELTKRDEELTALRRRQQELKGLSQVQSKYQLQMSKLESEIETMKRQRVDLTKAIQSDKKKHVQALADKAKEIESLKRALNKSLNEAKKLSKDKERAEEKVKEALREGAVLRKRANDLQRFGGGSDISRNVRRAMGAVKANGERFLTEDELRVKRWLDRRIAEITAREEAAEALRQQCEQQLALLSRKEALEAERKTFERSVRDVIIGGGSLECGGESFDSVEATVPRPLTSEEEELLRDIEERIDSVEGQLKLRNQNITEMESKLAIAREASEDKTVETLKRTAAVSLPAAHELIRLLFDMLVGARHVAQQRKYALARCEAKERQLRDELDDASARTTAIMRAHDMELTMAAHEYEEKLQSLLSHSAAGLFGDMTGSSHSLTSDSDMYAPGESYTHGRRRHSSHQSTSDTAAATAAVAAMASSNALTTTTSGEPGSDEQVSPTAHGSTSRMEDQYKMMLAVSTEQCNALRTQVSLESRRSSELLSRIYELEHARIQLQRDLEEKDIHIKFLEDERKLFRDMADDLRSGLTTLGGTVGQTILKQVRERAAAKAERDNRSVNLSSFDNIEQESELGDETESLLGEYSNLADVITRTGGVTEKTSSNRCNGVYARLTNPINFTGAMKSVFEEDLAKKRQKVQLIKSGQIKRDFGFGSGSVVYKTSEKGEKAGGDVRRKRNQHIADYLDGGGGDDMSVVSENFGGSVSITGGHHRVNSPLSPLSEINMPRMLSRPATAAGSISVSTNGVATADSSRPASMRSTSSASLVADCDSRDSNSPNAAIMDGVADSTTANFPKRPSREKALSLRLAGHEDVLQVLSADEGDDISSVQSAPPRMFLSNLREADSLEGLDASNEGESQYPDDPEESYEEISSANPSGSVVRLSSQERRLVMVKDRLYAATTASGRRNIITGGIISRPIKPSSSPDKSPRNSLS